MHPTKAHFALLSLALIGAFGASATHAQSAAEPGPDAIRAMLLATPVWDFEMSHEVSNQVFVNTGQVRFEQQGDKLVSKLDWGWKCESDVELFVFSVCFGPRTLKFNPADSKAPFREIFGSYTYIIRPATP